jgi:hypothetical protein
MTAIEAALLSFKVAGPRNYGYGFGLGSRVLMNVAESGIPGSVGEFGWGSAAKFTYYWVDLQEEIVGIRVKSSISRGHIKPF